MTEKIKVITSPDVVFDQAISILVISPDIHLKKSLEDFIAEKRKPLNLYLYFGKENDIKWLLTVAKISDHIIIDLDNSSNDVSKLAGYILSLPNSYYKTSDETNVWQHINSNRFYDFPEIKGY